VSGPDALGVSTSTLLGTVSQTSDSTTSVPPEKPNKSQPTIYSNEKEKLEESPLEKKEEVYVISSDGAHTLLTQIQTYYPSGTSSFQVKYERPAVQS
jgi:hypothetical protein